MGASTLGHGMTPKDMATTMNLAMHQAYPEATISEQVSASFLLTSNFITLIMEGSEEEVKDQNQKTLEGLVMGLFSQLNPPAITH